MHLLSEQIADKFGYFIIPNYALTYLDRCYRVGGDASAFLTIRTCIVNINFHGSLCSPFSQFVKHSSQLSLWQSHSKGKGHDGIRNAPNATANSAIFIDLIQS